VFLPLIVVTDYVYVVVLDAPLLTLLRSLRSFPRSTRFPFDLLRLLFVVVDCPFVPVGCYVTLLFIYPRLHLRWTRLFHIF
jgi:hypothetical protein